MLSSHNTSIYLALDAVLVVHGLFILYVLLGGLLVFFSKRMVWPHLLTVAWGIWIELFAGTCPLTVLEWKLRSMVGLQQYQGGFIDHYLTAAIYPSGLSRDTQHWLGLILVTWSVAVYALVVRHWRKRRGTDSAAYAAPGASATIL